MRFLGNVEAKTDAKGRVFLPATFRKQLQTACEEQLVLRTDVHGKCLVLYPESAWNKRLDEITAKVSEWDEEEQMVLRAFMAESADTGRQRAISHFKKTATGSGNKPVGKIHRHGRHYRNMGV